jgi:hypothetical protein
LACLDRHQLAEHFLQLLAATPQSQHAFHLRSGIVRLIVGQEAIAVVQGELQARSLVLLQRLEVVAHGKVLLELAVVAQPTDGGMQRQREGIAEQVLRRGPVVAFADQVARNAGGADVIIARCARPWFSWQ